MLGSTRQKSEISWHTYSRVLKQDIRLASCWLYSQKKNSTTGKPHKIGAYNWTKNLRTNSKSVCKQIAEFRNKILDWRDVGYICRGKNSTSAKTWRTNCM